MKNKKKCDWCEKDFRISALQKCKGKLICKVCKKKEEKKKGFVNIYDIKKEDREKEKLNQIENIKETKFPEIKGSKVKKKFNRRLSFALSFDEQRFLFRKHMNSGASFEAAKEIIKEDKEFLREFVKEMRKEVKSEEEINRRFKEEFAKLCEK